MEVDEGSKIREIVQGWYGTVHPSSRRYLLHGSNADKPINQEQDRWSQDETYRRGMGAIFAEISIKNDPALA